MKCKGVWLAVFCMSIWLAGCGKYDQADMPKENIEAETVPLVTLEQETKEPIRETDPEQQRVEKDGKIPSYLTGEMTDIAIANRRPIAIMISNDKEAQPSYGINHAGVVYEAPVEGGMNRFMAIIEDYDTLDRIGSVRSCRTYYTFFAREFEAIYAHFGQSVFAQPYLDRMEHLNGISGKGAVAFFRTKDRYAPHNAYASAAGLENGIAALGYTKEYPDTYKGHYRFAKPEIPVILKNGVEAVTVKPGYLYNAPWFEFHKEDGLYYRFQYGGPHMGNEGQLTAKNIIFQYCPTGFYKPTEYLDMNLHAPGVGYYFTNGICTNITWIKEDTYGVTRYYDNNGQEILLNPGKTWICIIPFDRVDKAEFYGEQTN